MKNESIVYYVIEYCLLSAFIGLPSEMLLLAIFAVYILQEIEAIPL